MIFEAVNYVLRFLYVASHVDDLSLQVLINDLHGLPLGSCPVGLPLFVVSGELIFLDELQEFHVVILQLRFGVLQGLRLPPAFGVKFADSVLNHVLGHLNQEKLLFLLDKVIDVLLVFSS